MRHRVIYDRTLKKSIIDFFSNVLSEVPCIALLCL